MYLSVDPHHSQKSHGFFLYFCTFQLVPFYYMIFMHALLHFYHPLHLPRSSPYRLHSNSTCSSVSTCLQPQQSSSYFHAIVSFPLTYRHPPITISLTLAPTRLSSKHSLLNWTCFHFHYSFSLSVTLNSCFHASLPTSCII